MTITGPIADHTPTSDTWDEGPLYGSAVERVWYTDPAGNETDLTTIIDDQYKQGIDGRFMPSIQLFSDLAPGGNGAYFRGVRATPGLVTVTELFVADDVTMLRAKLRGMAARLSPFRGLGFLTVETSDGLTRRINCIYESGFAADPATDGEEYEAKVALNFRAFDPFWEDTEVSEDRHRIGISTFHTLPLRLPFRMSGSSGTAQWTEINDGDVEAWPVWEIAGAATDVRVILNGIASFSVAGVVGVNDGLLIDTRPGVKTVVTRLGQDRFPDLRGTLFPIPSGESTIAFTATDPDANCAIGVQYFQRFNGV
jgi:hypothetical protein